MSLAAATYDASRLLYSSVAFVDDPPSPSSPEPGAFTTSTHRVLSTELRLPKSQETQSSAAPALIGDKVIVHSACVPSKRKTSVHIDPFIARNICMYALPQSRQSACSARTSFCHGANVGAADAQL